MSHAPGTDPIPVFRPHVSASARARLLSALDSGWIGYGPECRRLEQRFTGARDGWALATSSCTSALYLAGRLLRSLSNIDDPEVIVPAVTFVASGMAFLQAGVRPVVAEVDPGNLLLDLAGAEQALTAKTRALLVVHLYGQRSPDLSALRAFATRHRLLLIEDCAHRVDLLDDAPPVGDLLCYSFNAVKELPGGEGGLLWGRDRQYESAMRSVSNLGLAADTMQRTASLHHADYDFASEPGLKLRSSDLCAALVHAAIDSLAGCRQRRREQFHRYDRLLAALAPAVQPLARGVDDSCLMYVVKVDTAKREHLRAAMAASGIATSVHYPSLARHPLFGRDMRGAGCSDQDECITTLPTFLELTNDGQQRVADSLSRALDDIRQNAAVGIDGDREAVIRA